MENKNITDTYREQLEYSQSEEAREEIKKYVEEVMGKQNYNKPVSLQVQAI